MSRRLIAVAGDGTSRDATVGAVLHRGGAAGAIIEDSAAPDLVMKLYHTADLADRHVDKVMAMLSNPPSLPPITYHGVSFVQIAWPVEALFDHARRFVGFTMPRIDVKGSAPVEWMMQRATRQRWGLPKAYGTRLWLAANLAAVVAELHARGHFIIDMKPGNLRFYRRSLFLAVLDCDGFSVQAADGRRFPAQHYSDSYIAPEAMAVEPERLGRSQDEFALAVIVFQLFNNGLHPFQGVPTPDRGVPADLQGRIGKGLFSYGRKLHPDQAPAPGSIHCYFEDSTAKLFRRAFATRRRPSAADWHDHIRSVLEGPQAAYHPCEVDRENHGQFTKGCGFCALEGRPVTPMGRRWRKPSGDWQAVSRFRTSLPAIKRWQALMAGAAVIVALAGALYWGAHRQLVQIGPDLSGAEDAVNRWRATTSVNIRAAPTTASAIVGGLQAGEEIDVLGLVEGGAWSHVRLSGGGVGYVAAQYLETVE